MIHHISRHQIDYTHGLDLFVFGDMQWTPKGTDGKSRAFDDDAWAQFRAEFKASKNAVALGLGDYGDWLRPSMRSRVQGSTVGDDSARQQLDNAVRRVQDDLIREMDFLEGKLIGLHQGHHSWEFLSGGNVDQRLAAALKAPYLGWMAGTRMVLTRFNRTRSGGFVYSIASQHGNSNARRVGPTATWMENNMVTAFGADQYIMGHGCKSMNFVPNERQEIRRHGPAGVERRLPRCLVVGGFSRSFTNGFDSSYAERAGYSPQPIGWGLIRFKVKARVGESRERGVNDVRNKVTKSLIVEQLNRTPEYESAD